MDVYDPTYLYQQGTCGQTGGIETVSCGLSIGVGFGGRVWRGFCLCGWGCKYWRGVEQEAISELMTHARFKGWGALAYDMSRAEGFAIGGHSSLEEAKHEALIGCNSYNAQVLTWGYKSYLVLAKSRNGHIGYASEEDRKLAEKYALDACRMKERDSKITSVFHTVSGTVYKLERPFG